MTYLEVEKKLYDQVLASKDEPLKYMKSILSFSSVLEKLYPKEFNEKMKKIGVLSLMKDLYDSAGVMIKEIENFQLNVEDKTIEVNMDGMKLCSPVVDLGEYIEKNLGLDKTSVDYLLVLSFLSRTEHFEMFQITQAIILKE